MPPLSMRGGQWLRTMRARAGWYSLHLWVQLGFGGESPQTVRAQAGMNSSHSWVQLGIVTAVNYNLLHQPKPSPLGKVAARRADGRGAVYVFLLHQVWRNGRTRPHPTRLTAGHLPQRGRHGRCKHQCCKLQFSAVTIPSGSGQSQIPPHRACIVRGDSPLPPQPFGVVVFQNLAVALAPADGIVPGADQAPAGLL